MTQIKAIETVYKGYRFRSRLEARYAVMFDTLGLEWEYEKEGYDLGIAGWYLPDFWLPQVQMWAEVKAEKFTQQEYDRCFALSLATQCPCLQLVGMPKDEPYPSIEAHDHSETDEWGERILETEGVSDFGGLYCLTMHKNYPIGEHRFYCDPGGESDSHFKDTARAVIAARSARFEHGQNGTT